MKEEQNKKEDNRLSSNAANEPTPIYLTGDSTLQTPDENQRDKANDQQKDDSMDVSRDDLHETDNDRARNEREGVAEKGDEDKEG